MRSINGIIAGCTLLIALITSVSAQEPSGNPYDLKKLKRFFEESAQKYKITTESGEVLQRREQATLNMRNDERLQNQTGSIFLWEKKDGRPAAIIMIFSYYYGGRYLWKHELLSVADEPFNAQYDGELAWTPSEKGLDFKVIKDVTPPAATPAMRLTQMRQIARDFKGDLNITGQPSAHLRLMPTPIHRYEVPTKGVVDGSFFSLAVDTDYEILLALEAHKAQDGAMTWNWAVARAHYHELILQHKDEVVWKAPKMIDLEATLLGQMPYARMTYFLFTPNNPLPPPEELK